MNSLEKRIDEVLSQIDFCKIKKVMEFLDWSYYNDDSNNIYGLVKTAKRLLENCWENYEKEKKDYEVSTGGFKARVYKDGYLSLHFILDSGYEFEREEDK